MSLSAAMSVASFSIVLAESFTAVGLSTLIPNAFVSFVRAAKGAGKALKEFEIAQAEKTAADATNDQARKARALAALEDAQARKDATAGLLASAELASNGVSKFIAGLGKVAEGVPTPDKILRDILKGLADTDMSMDLLIPKTAQIKAHFEFHAREQLASGMEVGGQISMVTVKGGYNALYESRSSNTVDLEVNFATVAVGA